MCYDTSSGRNFPPLEIFFRNGYRAIRRRSASTAAVRSSPAWLQLTMPEASSFGDVPAYCRRKRSAASPPAPSLTSTYISPLAKDSFASSGRCSSPAPIPGGGEAVPNFSTAPFFLR